MQTTRSFPLLSWSKIKLFFQCPRCFFKDQRLQLKRPDLDAEFFSIPNIIDQLWKKELNIYRELQVPHPLLAEKTNYAVPLIHESLENWQDYKKGIRVIDYRNQIELCGVIDDILINANSELIVVDYKATANPSTITHNMQTFSGRNNLQQVSFYSFLLKKLGFKVSANALIVYSLALKNRSCFDQKIEFETFVLSCPIDYSWIELTLQAVHNCLTQNHLPKEARECKYCAYELSSHACKNKNYYVSYTSMIPGYQNI